MELPVLITGASDLQAYRFQKFIEQPALFGEQIAFKSDRFLKIPDTKSTSFIHQFLDLCLENSIRSVFPLRYEEQKLLTEAKQLFFEYDIEVIVPEVAEIVNKQIIEQKNPEFILLNKGELIKGDLAIPTETLMNKTGVYYLNESKQIFPFYLC